MSISKIKMAKTDNHDHMTKTGNSVNKNQDFMNQKYIIIDHYKSPVANINLPRSINKQSQLQAANPAFEITRLSAMLGLGSRVLNYYQL